MSRHKERAEFIRTWYPSKGSLWCAERLGCSRDTVYRHVDKLGLRLGVVDSVAQGREVLVSDLALEADASSMQMVRLAAQREGVLKITKTPEGARNRVTVPRWWADKFIADYREAQEAAKNYSHYIPLPEAAELLDVPRSTLTKYVTHNKGTLKRYLDGVHVVRGGWRHGGYRVYLFEPLGLDEARRKIDEERRLARQWVTVKSLTIECSVTRKSVCCAAVACGEPHRVFMWAGTLAAFVSPETAAKIREYYGIREAA